MHGAVDGPIPEEKLCEFEKVAARASSTAPAAAAVNKRPAAQQPKGAFVEGQAAKKRGRSTVSASKDKADDSRAQAKETSGAPGVSKKPSAAKTEGKVAQLKFLVARHP